jgi:hypothetical protein
MIDNGIGGFYQTGNQLEKIIPQSITDQNDNSSTTGNVEIENKFIGSRFKQRSRRNESYSNQEEIALIILFIGNNRNKIFKNYYNDINDKNYFMHFCIILQIYKEIFNTIKFIITCCIIMSMLKFLYILSIKKEPNVYTMTS